MKRIFLLTALLVGAHTAHADTVPTKLADVLSATQYRCTQSDGTSRTSILNPQPGETCTSAGRFFIPNFARPGLVGYGVIAADDSTGVLVNINRITVRGRLRDAWILLTYAQTQHDGPKPYTRIVAKWTIDCGAHTYTYGASTLYSVSGDNTEVAGSMLPNLVPTDAVPNSIADNVVQGICDYTPGG
jgi:hypothetical protein